MSEKPIEILDFNLLVEHFRQLDEGLVTFDGCDGAGKTTLARAAAEALGCCAVDLDKHLVKETGEFIGALRVDEFAKNLDDAFTSSRVVLLSGVCMQEALLRIGRQSAIRVYVQKISRAGIPCDLEFIDVENGIEASPDVLALFEELHMEVYAYHRRYRPRSKSDIVFIRKAE